MTWQQWLVHARTRLINSTSPKLDAEILLGHITGIGRTSLIAFGETKIDNAQLKKLEDLLVRRQYGEPIAYLTGEQEFWSLSLTVSVDTIIPRSDTECLVEKILHLWFMKDEVQVLDLGTGTGAIALAIASERSSWHITGVDYLPQVVTIAIDNANRLGLKNVQFLCGNWFQPLQGKRYNLIVSNPPYIKADDIHLSQGDVRFEPKSALVANDQGLADLKCICRNASTYLFQFGWLVLEHGWQQGKIVRNLLIKAGFSNITTVCDYGGNMRASLGQWTRLGRRS